MVVNAFGVLKKVALLWSSKMAVDAFGIFKEKGVYQKSSEVVLRVLRKNQSNIVSFLYLTSVQLSLIYSSWNELSVMFLSRAGHTQIFMLV